MLRRYLKVLIFLLLVLCHHESSKFFAGSLIDANASDPIAKDSSSLSQVTVIVLGMARMCHPSIALFRKIWFTHEKYMDGFTRLQRIVVLDGFGDVRLDEKNKNLTDVINETDYEEFKRRLRLYLSDKNRTDTGKIVITELTEHGGLLGAMRSVLPMIKTPIIYVAQDDLGITHTIPTIGVIDTMLECIAGRNPARFILLNKRQNGRATRIDDFFGAWEAGNSPITNTLILNGAPNKSITVDPSSIHVPLMRTKRWSDNNHFALTNDYTHFILPEIRNAKKWVDSYHQTHLWRHPEDWYQYGTHLLGEQMEDAYIFHFSGRDPVWCNETTLDEYY
jgi:hypothetical protein